MVPRGLLKEWAMHTFPTASDYWTFRKNVINAIFTFLTRISNVCVTDC